MYSRKFKNEDYTVNWNQSILKNKPETTQKNHLYKFSISEQDCKKLIEYLKETHYMMFPVLLAAFSKVILDYSLNNAIAIGIPVSSRGSNSNECIGPFINTVPVLIRNTNDIKDYMILQWSKMLKKESQLL